MKPRSKVLEAPGTEVRQLDTSPAVQVSAVTMRTARAEASCSACAARSSVAWGNTRSARRCAQPLNGADRARLDVLDVEAGVDPGHTMGEVAHGDHIDPGLSDGDDRPLIDAAGRLGDGAAIHQL